MGLSTTEIAATLGVSKGRVSQYVAAGKLDGCFTGEGRARRFDLQAVCNALGRKLDFGQMMGNGAGTRRTLAAIRDEEDDTTAALPPPRTEKPRDGAELPQGDAGRYELARAQKAEEEARRMRRQNLQDEGQYVLASEVERQVAKVVGQEVAEFEGVLRAGARAIADRMGVDFKTARQILTETWRGHRSARAAQLGEAAGAGEMSPAEIAADS